MRNIRQNLFFAFVYNVVGVPVAAGVLYPFFGMLLSPVVAALAMALSSVSVIGNALRLRRRPGCEHQDLPAVALSLRPGEGRERLKRRIAPNQKPRLWPRRPRLPLFAYHKTWMAGPRPSPDLRRGMLRRP